MHRNAHNTQSTQKYIIIHKNALKNEQKCTIMHNNAQSCTNMYKNTQKCTKMHNKQSEMLKNA